MQNNLKALRKAAGISQKKMADDLGVAVSTVQNWESDRTAMTGHSLVMVADYLGVEMDAVYGRMDAGSVLAFDPRERSLGELYRSCSEAGRQRICEYAEMIAREYPAQGKED